MKVSFSQIADTDAYQTEAGKTAKANIFVATVVAVLIMLFASWGFGLLWFIIIPCLWFVSSILIAFPFMMLRTAAVSALSDNVGRARAVVGIIDLLNYVVLIPATYYGLWYLHKALS